VNQLAERTPSLLEDPPELDREAAAKLLRGSERPVPAATY
jgi:hypothetical protein